MKWQSSLKYAAVYSGLLVLTATGAQAANVTGDVIFGSGNANGSWTIGTDSDGTTPATIELGLRGKVRFNDSNLPENTFNYDGVDTYTFEAGLPPSGFGFAAGSSGTAKWNFEWSINSDIANDGTNLTRALNDLTYELRIDGDPSAAVNFLTFDPINVPYADHALGNSSTGNGAGTVIDRNAVDRDAQYAAAIDSNSLAQNSWNYEFFNDAGSALEFFNALDVGSYRIELEAFSNGISVASTAINIQTVPIPGAAPLMLSALAGFAWLRRRRNA